MRHTTQIAFILLFSLFLHAPVAARSINVIPTPQSVVMGEGAFKLTSSTRIEGQGKGAGEVADFFIGKLYRAGMRASEKRGDKKQGSVIFKISATAPEGREAYALEIGPQGVLAQARTTTGLFYAAQTLLQLLPPQVEATAATDKSLFRTAPTWELPFLKIEDAPRFSYRGVMLDPCRHFIPVSAVKKHIEQLAAFKINKLHWHLTDDQGWRIEIKKYPLLTKVGAYRTEGDGSNYGGYYTQEEVKDVVEYARKHHIDIVPELEMPGHGMAAIAAYPWLSCHGDTVKPRIIWGVEDVVICPGRETTFTFLKDVIDEMLPLFPGELFHIGGDECPRQQWKTCDSCQALMHQEKYTRLSQLQSYTVGEIGKYLKQKGKRLIGWDEILEGGNLDSSAIVMSWRGEDGGITAAGMGHQVLMTPSSHGFYFDQFQGDYVTEPTAIGGYSPLEKVYAYDPVPKALKETGKEQNVLGVQANCWSEYIHTTDMLEYRLYPRALALAEVAWTQPARKNFADFCRRVDGDAALRLKAWNVNFHIPLPEQPEGCNDQLAFTDHCDLSLTTTRPLDIVYTTDGSQPTETSMRYVAPIRLERTTTVKTATLLPCGLMGPIRTISATKMSYLPAVEAPSGDKVKLSLYNGRYASPYILPAVPDTVITVEKIEAVRGQRQINSLLGKSEDYASVAEGYIDIKENGIYEFSSNNSQVWIDGLLTVDNSTLKVARFSPNKRQLALAKGKHAVKVVFLGGIFKGWPTYWDDGKVSCKKVGQ